MELTKRFLEIAVGDLLVLDVDVVEDRLVEQAPLLVVAPPVQLFGPFEQLQAHVDQAGGIGEVGGGGVEALVEVPSLAFDVAELGFDLGLRQGAVGCEVDQVLLLGVEFGELAGQLLVQQSCGFLLFADDGVDLGSDIADERLAEADRGVVPFDGVLNQFGVDVWGVAGAVLPVAAKEVQVFGPLGVPGALDDHPLGNPGSSAAPAEQRALEVVVVHPPPLLGRGPGVDPVLNPVEEVFVYQRLVPTSDLFALVGHVADVVAVPQHLRELVDRDLLRRVLGGGTGAQTAVVEFVGQLIERVVAGVVQLEGELYERRPLVVEDDGADHPAVGVVDVVEIPDLGAAESPASAGFLPHLVGDVGAGLAGLVLVEGGQDAVHELSDGRVIDRFGGGDERDAALAEVSHDDGVVVAVPRHAGEHVDDDVVDITLSAHACQHPLECFPFGHLRRRAAGLDILIDDGQAQVLGLAQARLPLGRDRDALGVVVGLNLPSGGHAQVDDRTRSWFHVIRGVLDWNSDILLQLVVGVSVCAGHDSPS